MNNIDSVENRDWYPMAGLILLGIGIRCFMWYWIDASYLGDMIHYVDVAKDIGDGYLMKALSAITPPLYPLLIHIFHLLIQDYDISARLVNVVFGGLLVYPVFWMAFWVYGRRTAIVAGCMTVFAGELINYSLIGYAESVYLFFVTMAIYKAVKAIRLKSNLEMFYSGLFFGLTFLTKSQAKLFFAWTLLWVLVFLTIANRKIIARGIIGVLLLVIGFGIVAAPYNYLRKPAEAVNVIEESDAAAESDAGIISLVKSVYSRYFNINLRYEKDYMRKYVLHKDLNGNYYMGGGASVRDKTESALTQYFSVLADRLIIRFPNLINHLFPLILLFFMIGVFKKEWNIRIEGYLITIIIVNIMASSTLYWNARYLDTLMPIVLIIGANGIIRGGPLLGGLVLEKGAVSEESLFSKGGRGWTILIAGAALMISLVLLLKQKPDFSYNSKVNHQKEVAEKLKVKFGNNIKIMSWGDGGIAIPYYMGVRLSNVVIIPIASLDMLIGYAKQEGVELLAFDTQEINRYPGLDQLLMNNGDWPGLQLVMMSSREGNTVFSYKAWYPDSGWLELSTSGGHAIVAFKVI